MAASAFHIALFFVCLGLAASLLVALHDAVAAHLERRPHHALRGRGEGGLPLPLPAPRAPRRPERRRAPRPATAKASAPSERSPERPAERPAWLENARRDLAHR